MMKYIENTDKIILKKTSFFLKYILSGFSIILGILKFILPSNFSNVPILISLLLIVGGFFVIFAHENFVIEFNNREKAVNVTRRRFFTKKNKYIFSEIGYIKLKHDDPFMRKLIFGGASPLMLLSIMLKNNKEIIFALGLFKFQIFIGNKNFKEWSKILDKISNLTGIEVRKEDNTFYSEITN